MPSATFWSWLLLVMLTTGYVRGCTQPLPNIVFIMVDDMGWNDVSYHGSNQIQTPNLDSLAYHSVILKEYYSEAICTPARTALLTGKYPSKLGMQGTPLYNSENRGIPLNERLLSSYLKELGYATHLVGKWHLGFSREEYLPTSRCYDSHFGVRGGFIDYYTHYQSELWPNNTHLYGLDFFENLIPIEDDKRYSVDAFTDRAIEIIEQHNPCQPLFLHVAHNAPHSGNEGNNMQPPLYSPVNNNHVAEPNRRLLAEVITHLDRSIGRLIGSLNENRMLDNTIIVFVSDNGAPTFGSMRNWGVNLPFRGQKMTPWEGAVRVPAFVWHSSLKPKVWNGLMHVTDWLPTLLSAAGGQIENKIDGVDQWNSISEDGSSKRNDVLIYVDNSSVAYRAGDYKVIIGNLSSSNNGYLGGEYLLNKHPPPDYYSTLQSSEVALVFESIGLSFDFDEIEATRDLATVKQYEVSRDPIPCLPTPIRGCLYNVREDPTESRNLWTQSNKLAIQLTNKARILWASQRQRGPTDLQIEADPKLNPDFAWQPWLAPKNINNQDDDSYNELPSVIYNNNIYVNDNSMRSNHNGFLDSVNCNNTKSYTNILCILRSIF